MERNYHCFYLSVSKYCITLFLFMIFFFLISKTNRSLLHQSFCFFYFLFPIEQCFFIVIHILLATSRKLPLLRGGVGFQADERNAVLIAGAKIISESDYTMPNWPTFSSRGRLHDSTRAEMYWESNERSFTCSVYSFV